MNMMTVPTDVPDQGGVGSREHTHQTRTNTTHTHLAHTPRTHTSHTHLAHTSSWGRSVPEYTLKHAHTTFSRSCAAYTHTHIHTHTLTPCLCDTHTTHTHTHTHTHTRTHLRPADAWHAVHGEQISLLLRDLVDERRVLRRVHEADQGSLVPQRRNLQQQERCALNTRLQPRIL